MGSTTVPSDLLRAVAARQGQVAFVVGAGCSLESPTDLRLASVYSEDAFETLKRDGVLSDGDCDPSDLSEVASAVFAKEQSQASLVQVLPREKYAHARPNLGHLLAIALIAEGAISCIATVNFDMALSNAITALQATDIATVGGPEDLGRFGAKAIVYLHRNAHERNVENWILRKEVIEEFWKEGWESVVAERVSSSPHLVFAGLGSKAAALTESLRRVQERVPDQTRTFLVDPASTSVFAGEIALANDSDHIQLRWGEFMVVLATRLAEELRSELAKACEDLEKVHGWSEGVAAVDPVLRALGRLNLCELGATRGQWLGTGTGGYTPEGPAARSYVTSDAGSCQYMADLVLGLGALVVSEDCTVDVTPEGTVIIDSPGNPDVPPLRVHPVSGRGIAPWGVLDKVEQRCRGAGQQSADVILVSGLRSRRPDAPSPPDDIVGQVPTDDITYAVSSLKVVDVDELRLNPDVRVELAR